MNQRNEHIEIPDWKCERYLLHELDEAEMDRIGRLAQSDASLRMRLEALERSNRDILQEYPADWMSRRISERLDRSGADADTSRRRWRALFPRPVLVPAGILAAAAMAIFFIPMLPTGDPTELETTRIKGSGAQLRVYRQTESGSQQLEDGAIAAEGDVVLLQYQADEHSYGAILSVDGRGTITTHLPTEGTRAALLEPGQSRFLEFAYELDDAPRWELFLFLSASSAFQLDGLIQGLESSPLVLHPDELEEIDDDVLRTLDLPEEIHLTKFLLMKE